MCSASESDLHNTLKNSTSVDMRLCCDVSGTPCHMGAVCNGKTNIKCVRIVWTLLSPRIKWSLPIVEKGMPVQHKHDTVVSLLVFTSVRSALLSCMGTWDQSGEPNFIGHDTFRLCGSSSTYAPGLIFLNHYQTGQKHIINGLIISMYHKKEIYLQHWFVVETLGSWTYL